MAESLAPPLHKDPDIQALVVPTLLYGAETWVSIGSRSGCWSGFTNAVCALNGKTTRQVLETASLPSMESILPRILLRMQLRWAGHTTRMEDVRMTKAIFFSVLQEGKHDSVAPRKPYKNQLKRQLAQAGISHQS